MYAKREDLKEPCAVYRQTGQMEYVCSFVCGIEKSVWVRQIHAAASELSYLLFLSVSRRLIWQAHACR